MASAWNAELWSWSPLAEQVVSRLLADLPQGFTPEIRAEAERLSTIPIGASLWAFYFLSANGEVVVIGEDYDPPERVTIHSESIQALRALVWGSKHYPESKLPLPIRGPRALDCPCRDSPVFAKVKAVCPDCGGLGWLPAIDA